MHPRVDKQFYLNPSLLSVNVSVFYWHHRFSLESACWHGYIPSGHFRRWNILTKLQVRRRFDGFYLAAKKRRKSVEKSSWNLDVDSTSKFRLARWKHWMLTYTIFIYIYKKKNNVYIDILTGLLNVTSEIEHLAIDPETLKYLQLSSIWFKLKRPLKTMWPHKIFKIESDIVYR